MKGLVALAVLFAVLQGAAQAQCGQGRPWSYDDIDEVLVTHEGCGSTLTPGTPDRLDCSKYWIDFSDRENATYSQYNLEGHVGVFRVPLAIDVAREILRRHEFFATSPEKYIAPTDTDAFSVWIWRCGVLLAVKTYVGQPGDAGIASIVGEFGSVVTSARLTRIDDRPQIPPSGFDPWQGGEAH